MILLHVVIAVFSIMISGYTLFRPSLFKLRVNYLLIAATLASGTFLVVQQHSSMLQACATGLVYLTVVSSGILPAKIKLANKS